MDIFIDILQFIFGWIINILLIIGVIGAFYKGAKSCLKH